MTGSILLLAGPPGVGKSTVAGRLTQRSQRSVHLHTDDIYAWIARGYVEPWLPEAMEQNTVIGDVIAASAERFATSGYDVFVDGVLGPWFLQPWRAMERPVSYAVLLPNVQVARQRAADRGEHPLKDLDVVTRMHAAFVAHLDDFDRHVIDSTALDVAATADEVARRHDANDLLLR